MELNKEQVKHVADLARLYIKDEEYDKYKKQLSDILSEIEKIVNVPINNEEIMISPTINKNCYCDDTWSKHISHDDIFRNAKKTNGDYISVVKVIE